MSRPLRIEFPDALYHVTCRGNRREDVYRDNVDRRIWLEVMAQVCQRFHFVVHAYCQMTNHFHLLVETPEGNLGQGMRQLNSAYARYFNQRHALVGPLFQGRYKAILVQRESYLQELARYIVLNPVRAGLVAHPGDWRWSSYLGTAGQRPGPVWLSTTWMLACFGTDRASALRVYQRFVMAGIGVAGPWEKIHGQCVLGDERFRQTCRHQPQHAPIECPRKQRRALALTLEEYAARFQLRYQAMAAAYHSTAYSMGQIARYFGVSLKTVSRAVAAMTKTAGVVDEAVSK